MSVEDAAILLIAADVELCALVAGDWGGRGHRVSAVHDGSLGLRRALEEDHDLVVLDVMLPVLDGFELLRQLRKRSNVPVIMLTARAGEDDRGRGVGGGGGGGGGVADSRGRPFAAAELLGRIRAVLRRAAGATPAAPAVVERGALTLDPHAGEGFWNGAPLNLTRTEFAILEVLARAAGRVVSRDELSAVLHQREPTPYERSLDVHISHLRRKLDVSGESIIRTARGA